MPQPTWFLAFYLIGQAKTGISSLALMRQLGVHYRTAWLIHNKIMEAMCEREEACLLRRKVQLMMLTSAENAVVASLVVDLKTWLQSSQRFLWMTRGTRCMGSWQRCEPSPWPRLLTGAKRPWPVVVRCSATWRAVSAGHSTLCGLTSMSLDTWLHSATVSIGESISHR